MRAEDLPQPLVAALGEQVQIQLAKRGQEPIRVGDRVDIQRVACALIADLEPVVDQVGERQRRGEESGVDVLQR